MQKTALYDIHTSLGAKMVPFAGYEMPLQYKGLLIEHHAVRNSIGMFDVSHMGEFLVKGEKACPMLQHATSNDVSKLKPGQIQYSCIPNSQGGIVDDLLVYCLNENEYLLVVNASNIEKDFEWFSQINQNYGAELINVSNEWSLLAVQGPKATECLQTISNVNLSEIPYYHFATGNIEGINNLILSNTGYTGAGGFEVYVRNNDATQVWNAIMKAGESFGIEPAGLGARDTLRLEMGFCLYGNDINDETSPIEAGLGWITKFNKSFTNAEMLLKQKTEGPSRKLTGFTMLERGIPRNGYEICNASGEPIGIVTSGTQSPSLNIAIGMGYVPAALASNNSEIYISIRNTLIKAETCKIPFYRKDK
jgi:aminomethyltransferase